MEKENEMEEQHKANWQLLDDWEEPLKTSALVIQTELSEKGETKIPVNR